MLQALRSRVRVPIRWILFNLPNPSSRTLALGSTQPLIEMSTRDLPGNKGRLARNTDNHTAICEPIVWRKCGSIDVSQSYGPSPPVTGIALPFYIYLCTNIRIYMYFCGVFNNDTVSRLVHTAANKKTISQETCGKKYSWFHFRHYFRICQ
jgi:hypothetical protein